MSSFTKTAPVIIGHFGDIANLAQQTINDFNRINRRYNAVREAGRVVGQRLREFADRFQQWRRSRQGTTDRQSRSETSRRNGEDPEKDRTSSYFFPYYYPHYYKKTARRLWMPLRRRLGRRPVRLAFRRVRPWRVRGYRRYRRRRYY